MNFTEKLLSRHPYVQTLKRRISDLQLENDLLRMEPPVPVRQLTAQEIIEKRPLRRHSRSDWDSYRVEQERQLGPHKDLTRVEQETARILREAKENKDA